MLIMPLSKAGGICRGRSVLPRSDVATSSYFHDYSFLEGQAQDRTRQEEDGPPPFFLYVALSHMHVPLAYDPKFENSSSNHERQIYGNALAEGISLAPFSLSSFFFDMCSVISSSFHSGS